MLNDFVKKEWLSQGNKVVYCQANITQILIVLDNVSYHKRKDILSKIESEFPNIRLEFYLLIAGDYNLIYLGAFSFIIYS